MLVSACVLFFSGIIEVVLRGKLLHIFYWLRGPVITLIMIVAIGYACLRPIEPAGLLLSVGVLLMGIYDWHRDWRDLKAE